MSATIDTTQDQVIQAFGTFLQTIFGTSCPPYQGQQNDVPEPKDTNFVMMTPLWLERLSTNENSFTASSQSSQQSTKFTVQLDFHGPNGGDFAQTFSTLWRDEYACDYFLDNTFNFAVLLGNSYTLVTNTGASIGVTSSVILQPLYSDDPRQTPFINAEQDYEYRWTVDAHMQYNPNVTTIIQSALSLKAGVYQVDATYPP
jgi:hypothetical protein